MIIITGASRGIGRFLFEEFSLQGENVVGTYNSTSYAGAEPSCMYKVDISDSAEVEGFLLKIKDNMQQIILINSAGANYSGFAHKADIESWRKIVDVNLVGTFNVIHHVLKFMRDQNYGRIINFSSVVAQIGIPGTSAYAASKAGLWGLSKAIAAENASKGITINTLNLGYFNIGMINQVSNEMQEGIKAKIPVGHEFGNPSNIYQAIRFIINSDYLTGASIDINGGLF